MIQYGSTRFLVLLPMYKFYTCSRRRLNADVVQHDYLLHGMLALAASELAEEYPESSQLSCTAMSHRVKTIGALNAAISSGMTNFEQGNAMLATCFTMIFQSVLIEDGLAEYLTFIRGTVVVGIQMGMKKMHILFNHLFGDRDLEKIDPKMRAASLIEPELVRVAIRSLEKVAPLCKTKLEIEVYSMLLSSARALVTSSRDGKPVPVALENLVHYHDLSPKTS
jgi:hypothetical protein